MTYASTVLADGAVGLWALGESAFGQAAVDQAGNQNGTYVTTAGLTFGQTGIPGGGGATAVKFTRASNGLMDVPDVAAQRVVDVWSIEVWVKVGSTGGAQQNLFGSLNVNGAAIALLTQNPPLIQSTKTATAQVAVSTTGVPVDSAFHHILVTKNAATNKIYLDGSDVTGSVTNATCTTSQAYVMGEDRHSTNNYFDGTATMIGLYPTALTAAKALTHYRLGANLAPSNTVAPVASGSTTIGSAVSTTNGTWADAGSPTFTYQWQRDVLGNGVYTNIATATASTYTLVALDDACNVRCVVTDTDVVGATSANSNSILDTTPVTGGTSILLPLMGVG